MIGIEDGDVGGAQAFEGVVDIAGLGLEVIAAGDVADAGFDGKLAELFAVAVVEDVDVEPVGRPVNVERGEGGVAYDAEGLVVGGNEQVDFGPVVGIVGQGDGRAAQGPDGLQEAEVEDAEGVGFRAEEQDDEEDVDGTPFGAGILEEGEDAAHAPPAVAEGGKHGEHHEDQSDQVGVRNAAEPDAQQHHEEAEHGLLRPGERERAEEKQGDDAESDENELQELEERSAPGLKAFPKLFLGHRSLQRTPRCPVPAAIEVFRIQVTMLITSSEAGELGA